MTIMESMQQAILKLRPHFNVLCRRSFLGFCQSTTILHIRYRAFFFSGLFLHFLIKWSLWLIFDIQLPLNYNLVLLVLSIYFAIFIDIQYLIYTPLHKLALLTFELFAQILRYQYMPRLRIPDIIWMLHAAPNFQINFYNVIKCNSTWPLVDVFYILRLVWLFFMAIRYWIIREPVLFGVINLVVFINFLQEHHRWLLFLYLLCIQLSRFMFFMGSEYERFNYKRWFEEWVIMGNKLLDYFTFWEKYSYQKNPKPGQGIIFKFTWNNLNLAFWYNLRYEKLNCGLELERPESRSTVYVHLYQLSSYINNIWQLEYDHRYNLSTWYDQEFSEFIWWNPNWYKDCQKFVKCNQCFWLAILLLIIYLGI